jgi:hypothetical protein
VSKTAHSSIGVFQHESRTPRRSRDIEMLGFLHAVGDERSTAESHPRCGSVREGFGCFDHPSLSHLCGPGLFLFCRTSRDNPATISRPTGAGHRYIVQPRSSGHVPSGTAATAIHIVSRPPSTEISRRNAGGEGVSISASTESTFSKSRAAYRPRDPARWLTWVGQNYPQPGLSRVDELLAIGGRQSNGADIRDR